MLKVKDNEKQQAGEFLIQPSRLLDGFIGVHLMRYPRLTLTILERGFLDRFDKTLPFYSLDPRYAMELYEKILSLGWHIDTETDEKYFGFGAYHPTEGKYFFVEAETFSLATCRLAIDIIKYTKKINFEEYYLSLAV